MNFYLAPLPICVLQHFRSGKPAVPKLDVAKRWDRLSIGTATRRLTGDDDPSRKLALTKSHYTAGSDQFEHT
jgi:hypothetical protein